MSWIRRYIRRKRAERADRRAVEDWVDALYEQGRAAERRRQRGVTR